MGEGLAGELGGGVGSPSIIPFMTSEYGSLPTPSQDAGCTGRALLYWMLTPAEGTHVTPQMYHFFLMTWVSQAWHQECPDPW